MPRRKPRRGFRQGQEEAEGRGEKLGKKGIIIKSLSWRGIAYKHVDTVVSDAHNAGLSKKVARLLPVICVKG
ncbi:MAG: RtcB family protein [Brevinematales bacterium]